MNGVKGVYNFLNRAFRFFLDEKNYADTEDASNVKELHKLMKKVTEDIEGMRFNTAISQMMIFVNHLYKTTKVTKETAKNFALVLAPFAPHLAEELWAFLGHSNTLSYESWPTFNPDLAKDDQITVAVQVNGKTRGTFEVAADISKDELFKIIKSDEKIAKYLEGTIVKEIYVPGKICNFVVK